MTDVQGSTSLWERDHLQMRSSIELHDLIASQVFPEFGGQILKERGEGDSLFVAFDTPVEAIKAGVNFLVALGEAPWPTIALTTRIAIHVGDVVVRNRDYYGPSVNRCARIRSITNGGQILVSEAVERLVDGALLGEIQLRALGSFRLKDLLSPENLFQVTAPKLRQHFALPSSIDSTPHNLPVQLTSYVGRSNDIQASLETIKTRRLLTLTGPGGSGKTRLALQVAAEAMEHFSSGVIFIDLTPARAANVIPLISRTVHSVLNSEESEQKIVASDFNSKALLVLDNCEHVIDEVAQQAVQLLRSCPNLSIIATSRELLQCPGEVSYRVEALSFPPEEETDPDVIASYEAVQLFFERARQRVYDFTIDNANARDIGAICRELDGIPLAIEHASSQILAMSTSDMLLKLGTRMNLLRSRERGIVPRHATLRATIDWSYELLLDDERRLFPLLAVFQSGWDFPACASLAKLEGLAEEAAEDALNGLVMKSLVSLDGATSGSLSPTGPSSPRRFRLLETIKEYAREKLDNSDGRVSRAAFFYYMTLAERAYEAHGKTEGSELSNRIRLDMRNMLSLLSWGIANEEVGVLRFLGALRHCWRRFGYVKEGAALLESALKIEFKAPDELIARNWNILGTLYWSLDKLEQAEAAYDQSAKIYSAVGDELNQAGLLNNLALIQVARGRHERAISLMRDALAIYQKSGDWSNITLVSINVALEEIIYGQPEEALKRLASIEATRIEDVTLRSKVHKTAALAYIRLDRMIEARAELASVIQLWNSSRDVTILPSLFVFLAAATRGIIDPTERTQYLGAGEALAKTSFAEFSQVEEEIRRQAYLDLQKNLEAKDLDRIRRHGARLDPAILINRAIRHLVP